jgi:regulator of protease activity HflC (stomatin/prohibitin superfamily)
MSSIVRRNYIDFLGVRQYETKEATMAQIIPYPFLRHLRAEPNAYVLFYRRGVLTKSGPGLAFWFHSLSVAVAEIPIDNREQSFIFNGRTADFQQVAVQGSITYRITNPETVAKRIDFSIDLGRGTYTKEPLEKLASLITQLAQQFALNYIEQMPLRMVLKEGIELIRKRIKEGLNKDEGLENHGIEVIAVRLSGLSPTAEMEKALQAPTREAIQQEADQAAFARRALAVEKERAIAENELKNQIELARQEEMLIEQRGQNERRRATEEVESKRIMASASAERMRLTSEAKADSIHHITEAKNKAEQERMGIYRDLPVSILLGLAAQELASNLKTIEHLNLSPDALGSMLQNLLIAGTHKLEQEA